VVKWYGIKTMAKGSRQLRCADGSVIQVHMPNFAIKGEGEGGREGLPGRRGREGSWGVGHGAGGQLRCADESVMQVHMPNIASRGEPKCTSRIPLPCAPVLVGGLDLGHRLGANRLASSGQLQLEAMSCTAGQRQTLRMYLCC
jgi:hypothetical protein